MNQSDHPDERALFEAWWEEEPIDDVSAAAWREMVAAGATDIKTNAYIAWRVRAARTQPLPETAEPPALTDAMLRAFIEKVPPAWFKPEWHEHIREGLRAALASTPPPEQASAEPLMSMVFTNEEISDLADGGIPDTVRDKCKAMRARTLPPSTAPEATPEPATFTALEVWLACGGNPECPAPTDKEDLVRLMQLNAECADDLYEKEEAERNSNAPEATPAKLADEPLSGFYIGGPYHDGSFAVCETSTGRVVRKFRAPSDLFGPQLYKWSYAGMERYRVMAADADDADEPTAPTPAVPTDPTDSGPWIPDWKPSSNEYFSARPQIDTNDRRRVYEAGFKAAWDTPTPAAPSAEPRRPVAFVGVDRLRMAPGLEVSDLPLDAPLYLATPAVAPAAQRDEPAAVADLRYAREALSARGATRRKGMSQSTKIEQAIDAYLAGYEFEGEGTHCPGDFERFVIKDAIFGLLSDEDFVGATAPAERPFAWFVQDDLRGSYPGSGIRFDEPPAGMYAKVVPLYEKPLATPAVPSADPVAWLCENADFPATGEPKYVVVGDDFHPPVLVQAFPVYAHPVINLGSAAPEPKAAVEKIARGWLGRLPTGAEMRYALDALGSAAPAPATEMRSSDVHESGAVSSAVVRPADEVSLTEMRRRLTAIVDLVTWDERGAVGAVTPPLYTLPPSTAPKAQS